MTSTRLGMEKVREVSDLARWKPGAQILQQEMWGGRVGAIRPVTVVEDIPERLVLYSHPNTRIVSCGVENRRSMELSERIDLYMKMLEPGVAEYHEEVSPSQHVLTLTPAGSWHSIWLFWTADWRFRFWYVNFQSPVQRNADGIRTHDCALDMVVRPDLSWEWKDVDEFEELVSRGFFTDEQAVSVRADADRVVKVIESGGPPFCDGWEDWRPDSGWPVPHLPDNCAAISDATAR